MALPTSIKRARDEIEFPCECTSIAYYEGITYVGLSDGSIFKVNQNYEQHLLVDKYSDGWKLQALAVHNDLIYALCNNPDMNQSSAFVYDLPGNKICELNSPPYSETVVNLTVVGNKVVIPHADTNNLVVYSPLNSRFQQVPYTSRNRPIFDGENTNEFASICAVGEDSVVISDSATSTISRVNVATGLMWEYEDNEPGAVVCYQEKYVLLVAVDREKIRVRILDLDSEKLITGPLSADLLPSKEVVSNPDLSGKAAKCYVHKASSTMFPSSKGRPDLVKSGVSKGNKNGTSSTRKSDICSIALAGNTLVVAKPNKRIIQLFELK